MPIQRFIFIAIVSLGLRGKLMPSMPCWQIEAEKPSRVVLVVWGQEPCPLATMLDYPLSSLQKIASEQGYRLYQRDDINFILPNSTNLYKQLALNQFLQFIPSQLLQKGNFSLEELPEESQTAFRTYFSSLLPHLDYDSALRIGVNIFAKLPLSQSSTEREPILVASVVGGSLRSVDWASTESIAAKSRRGDHSNPLSGTPQAHLGSQQMSQISIYFNFNPSPHRIAKILREVALLLDEQQNQIDETRYRLIRQAIKVCLLDISLANGAVDIRKLPMPIFHSIESYCQTQGVLLESLGSSVELSTELFLSIPLKLSNGRTYISISLGGI